MTVTIHLTNGSLASAPNETDESPEILSVEKDGERLELWRDIMTATKLEIAVLAFLKKRPRQR